MSSYNFTLEPYKGMNTRYRCPSCNKGRTFTRYIITEIGEHIHPTVGRCNREANCGYHYKPKQYFQDNQLSFDTQHPRTYQPRPIAPKPKPFTVIPADYFKASLKAYDNNHFVSYLQQLFGIETTNQLISRYFIGTSKHWEGSTVFWQVDNNGKIRTGKIMLYNPKSGKRIKQPLNHITWVHTALKLPDFVLNQCLFGEHLLKDKMKPVAIVESEKTAIIASVYLPQFIWLASGGLSNLNADKCQVLKGRTVVLYPDLKALDKWDAKAKELSHIAKFQVSSLLQSKASPEEIDAGFDLADYLIRLKPREQQAKPVFQSLLEGYDFVMVDPNSPEHLPDIKAELHYQANWDKEIEDIEKFFSGIEPMTALIRLNQCSIISNVALFVDRHLTTVRANNGKPSFLPYLHRLHDLKQYLTQKNTLT